MLVMVEGFDKYGPANSNSTAVQALMTQGEWTSALSSVTFNIIAPLSSTGQALQITNSIASNSVLVKTLAASYARIIGGVRFSSDLAGGGACGIQFNDAGTAQCSIAIANSTGVITLRNSNVAGTVLATSGTSITANTVHYLEWDIALGNSAAYQVWLNGVSVMSGTGDTTATANNTINGLSIGNASGGSQLIKLDDLYLFDSTGTTNNAVLLTSPRIETQFPTGDGAVQFAVGAGILGSSNAKATTFSSTAANQLRVRSFTPTVNMTLNSITFYNAITNASIQLRPVVYSDSAGNPGTLMSGGSTVTGTTASTWKTLPLTTPQALTAGTQYWLGFMCDIAVSNLLANDSGTNDRTATSTFASGAPGTAPGTSAVTSTMVYGNVTVTNNWYEVSQNPTQGSLSYVYDATVGHEDLYTYPALSVPPSAIYAVAVKASVAKSDAGAKTVSVRLKSGATDSAGTGGTLAPGASYGWLTSHYPTDPATSAAWTLSALNAAQAGVKVES